MPAKSVTSHHNVRAYRERMKAQGFRQINLWVPDTRSAAFKKECRRQSKLASAAERDEPIDRLLLGAAGTVEGWT